MVGKDISKGDAILNKCTILASAAFLGLLGGCGNNSNATQADGTEAAQSYQVDPEAITSAALQEAVSSERVRAFYEARDWQPVWTSDNVGDLAKSLKGAGRHGLDPNELVQGIEDVSEPAAREAALTRAALELADILADGKADPNELFEVYTLPRPEIDIVAGLNDAVSQNRVGAWIEGLAPSDAEYRALSEAYLRFAEQASSGEDSAIGSGDLIRPGDSDPRVPRIVRVLEENGYLNDYQAEEGAQNRYTDQIASAVSKMQRDFGISDDGIVGPDALKILNTGAEERARLLAVNLERRRWYARSTPSTRIDVNTAAATLDYFRGGELRDQRRVIVGQPGWETPQLQSPMFRLVANPTWTVPKSIEREEIAPKGPGYLRENNMVRRDGWIVQQPGPDNALGQVKFDLQNDHAIYLHDTPAVSLFERNQRHLSHGCVRVNNALQFARMIAQDTGISAEFSKARDSGEETFVDIEDNFPVRLVYHTSFLAPSGEVRFQMDAYGWDDRIAKALGYEPRQSPELQTHIGGLGP